jgi:hypothetical protein
MDVWVQACRGAAQANPGCQYLETRWGNDPSGKPTVPKHAAEKNL